MRLVVDMMGGDLAPAATLAAVKAAALRHPEREYLAVGLPEIFSGAGLPGNVIPTPCGSMMNMDEDVRSLLKKKDSSIWVATELVKKGQAQAIVSAGSTGAQMAAATLLLGRLPGVERPAIATVVPSLQGAKVLLDVGANADCTPEQLLQFAHMGAVYSRLLGGQDPRVALLANGTEEHKGNNLTRAAYALIAASNLNFIGNLEGRDILAGDYEVMVCDGMSGNIAVKSIEGAMTTLMALLKREFTASLSRKLGAALVKDGLRQVKRALDYEEFGGAPLLGVGGLSLVCHGSSGENALVNALEAAASCVEQDFIGQMREALSAYDAEATGEK